MFDMPILELSTKIRSGPGQLAGEALATAWSSRSSAQ
jgi:hypothetical protein